MMMARPGEVILIVEDHADSRMVYKTLLGHYGYQTVEAANGAEGVERAREERPSAILMDVAMPVLDGLQATRLLSEDQSTRDIPVIIMTAHSRESDKRDAFAAGAVDYITKPCSPKLVVERLRRALDGDGREGERSAGRNDGALSHERRSPLEGMGGIGALGLA